MGWNSFQMNVLSIYIYMCVCVCVIYVYAILYALFVKLTLSACD